MSACVWSNHLREGCAQVHWYLVNFENRIFRSYENVCTASSLGKRAKEKETVDVSPLCSSMAVVYHFGPGRP